MPTKHALPQTAETAQRRQERAVRTCVAFVGSQGALASRGDHYIPKAARRLRFAALERAVRR